MLGKMLGVIGVALGLVLLIATGIAVAILYAVAKVYSKRFGARTRWRQGRAPGPVFAELTLSTAQAKTKRRHRR